MTSMTARSGMKFSFYRCPHPDNRESTMDQWIKRILPHKCRAANISIFGCAVSSTHDSDHLFHQCIAPSSRLSSTRIFLCKYRLINCHRESTFSSSRPYKYGEHIGHAPCIDHDKTRFTDHNSPLLTGNSNPTSYTTRGGMYWILE